MGEIIKGKPVADAITESVIREVEEIKSRGISPKLAIVRVGADPSDLAYERGAIKRMEKCGIDKEVIALPVDISQDEFIKELKKVNDDENVHGILVFRPMPEHLDEDIIKYVISPEKDVDCFSPVNVAKVTEGDETGFPPATPTAVMEIMKFYGVDLKGKHAVVIGRSLVVGKPVSMLLLKEHATVTICHSRTQDLPGMCRTADVLVAAVGKAKLVDDTYVKEGAVVLDVGINMDEDNNMCGDVDFDKCIEKASMITPVPAGVGSVTTSVLAKHVVKACRILNDI
ncbi:methylenetetrahydrofolate dehydrogenase (NADP+) / methenyltetrahydrofolate cyclohydrolase [Dethiosulfatibacter aminovorans DSM 17477]|uniref:Bifunctional protein FolD n=1 Tax=Dethiosulfatibacter aminovorans DSM 17477 TaxID=1121476 RepID=A0A1M6MW12_9FIRM|nr:tetrahydrofolate dehydrogenase/cyclohydrolase catalytic domain-containing protein [Dethiosulfatibacter aminovorans]SHJ87606.1 methylenetetrahydrofolate dehydrogenase (NADP+) / methenyltetrahydrofolate cyclohydrolase [Dethiosulfatibacter aminovorans DSM 17477]